MKAYEDIRAGKSLQIPIIVKCVKLKKICYLVLKNSNYEIQDFKFRYGGFVLNGKEITSHKALTVQKSNSENGKLEGVGQQMNDFLYIVKVPIKDLSYKSIFKKGAYKLMARPEDTPLEKLSGSSLKKLISNIAGVGIGYNRLDVYVPDGQKETFLNIAKDAKLDPKIINFIPQEYKGSTYEILPIKEETKTLEETK